MRVHKNLNKGCWSRKATSAAKVEHVEACALAGVRFKVSAAGHAKVVLHRVRAVHAWAEGHECEAPADLGGMVRVTYNPFRSHHFTRCDTGAAVASAALVVFTRSGECWAKF
jgi:hypothetical protein